jgi:hypothetical protein
LELEEGGESADRVRRIRAHVVIKADVRGSTLITERLYARGLNPASHFSLNFFEPVNGLLPQYGAEKVFVEGDAVILAIFEHEGQGAGSIVARACGLARGILQVVAVQNALNRKHGLPDLELGLGIAYVPQEPNFLFDEGHRIMISGAINRADRLSRCDGFLRRAGFAPEHPAFRVSVVHDPQFEAGEEGEDDLYAYNVDGVRIDESAFFRLQKELGLRPERLPEEGLEDALFFAGRFRDLAGRDQWLVVRYGSVYAWDGARLGAVDERRRHFFEVIVDEGLTNRVRRLQRNGST